MTKKFFTALCAILFSASFLNAEILFKVESPSSGKVSYIFGTHHLAPLSTLTDMSQGIQALADADVVVGEIDMTQDQMQLAMSLQKYMMAPADSTISKVLSPKQYELLEKEFAKWSPQPGISVKMLDGMKPMVISSLIAIGMMQESLPGYNPSEQLDSYVQSVASGQNKKIIPLETAELQGEVLYCSTPITVQAEMLMESIENPAQTVEQTVKLNNLYAAHDIDGLLKLTEADSADSPFMDALLKKRNANWLEELPKILDDNKAFIAVGALHLPGENGILKGLADKGYKITPIN